MANRLRFEASQLIDEIRENNGGLTDEERRVMDPKAVKIIDNLRIRLAATTKTLATNLYAKDTRFVYELIQNAEDNMYTRTTELSEEPSLWFQVSEDRIVIDSNEDGFTAENIRAICSVGQSTKSCKAGYIGEKGIGFKSVFKVAKRVHIQSQQYSFRFDYDRDTKVGALGMVTPYNEDHKQLPATVRTRMTLYLQDGCDRPALFADFKNLPDTLLLFLNKLRRVTVRLQPRIGAFSEKTYSLQTSAEHAKITIRNNENSSVLRFWIAKRLVTDLPAHEARAGITHAEVVIAFPIDAKETPMIAEQNIHAFLPLRKVGFKFLIQSDFITQASREDVFDCDWNHRLAGEVAGLFTATASAFQNHPTMRYQWIRFLPVDRIADEFWSKLRKEILKQTGSKPLFWTRHESSIHASSLRYLPDKFRSTDGEPLLATLSEDPTKLDYVSEKYDKHLDYDILSQLGVRDLRMSEFLTALQYDLSLARSRMRNEAADTDWQSRVSTLVSQAIEDPQLLARVDSLAIIPVGNDKWIHPSPGKVFFPSSGGITVPSDLNLSLVRADAAAVQARYTLFSALGVTESKPQTIIELIAKRYEGGSFPGCEQHFAHVKFLYWHHAKLPAGYSKLGFIFLSKGKSVTTLPNQATLGWIYCAHSKDDLAACNVLSNSSDTDLSDHIRLLYPGYNKALAGVKLRDSVDAQSWLHQLLDIRQFPRLRARTTDRRKPAPLTYQSSSPAMVRHTPASPEAELPDHPSCNEGLSSEFLAIANARPDILLGILKKNQYELAQTSDLDEEISNLQVPVLGTEIPMALASTFLPRPNLIAQLQHLKLVDGFGFISELINITDENEGQWHFCERFGVKRDNDFEFWLRVLKHARSKQLNDVNGMAEIYHELYRSCRSPEQRQVLSDIFEEDYIWVPADDDGIWHPRASCAWQGPEWYATPQWPCLARIEAYKDLHGFFGTVLSIQDVGVNNYLNLLEELAKAAEDPGSTIKYIYEALASADTNNEERKVIRTRSESSFFGLVYSCKTHFWHAVTNCVWAEHSVQLPDKISIATEYALQKRLFTEILGIEVPSLPMHVSGFMAVSKNISKMTKADVLSRMVNISALSPSSSSLGGLAKCKSLPVSTDMSGIQWATSEEDFIIVDRLEHRDALAGKISILDFSIEEIHTVKTFLVALGVAKRMSSVAVVEETKVDDEGTQDAYLTYDLRIKSYAICRLLAHHNSYSILQDPDLAFQQLRNITVYLSDAISKVLTLRIGEKIVRIPCDTANLHIDNGTSLKLYIPNDRKRQQICLSHSLPMQLMRLFRAETMPSQLSIVILTPDLDVVDSLLAANGIIELKDICRPEQVDYPSRPIQRAASIQHQGSLGGSDPDHSTITSFSTAEELGAVTQASLVSPTSTTRDLSSAVLSPHDDQLSKPPSPIAPSVVRHAAQKYPSEYKQLLNYIIDASQTAPLNTLPNVDRPNHSGLKAPPSLNAARAVHSADLEEKDVNVGAAGELFVFELLKALNLPNFDYANWPSNIRHRVRLHDKHASIPHFEGHETTDIVYEDTTGTLTKLLTQAGYFRRKFTQSASIRYLIEVKTTVGALEHEFFVSQSQHEHMCRAILPRYPAVVKEIYIIARVFNLGKSNMGLALYLDPEELRRQKKLQFKADNYSVTPANGEAGGHSG